VEVRFAQLLIIVRFLSANISQGSVATRLRCAAIVNQCIARNLLPNLPTKKF